MDNYVFLFNSYGRSSSRKSDRLLKRRTPLTLQEAKLNRQPRKRTISDDVSSLPVEKPALASPAMSIPSTCSSTEDMSSSVGCYPVLGSRVQIE